MQEDNFESPLQVKSFDDRVALCVYAAVIATIATWMWWMVATFANGNDWWDFGVQFVLHDLILAVYLFALALIAHAVFPHATGKLLLVATKKLSVVLWLLIVLFCGAFLLISIVYPLLDYLGVLL